MAEPTAPSPTPPSSRFTYRHLTQLSKSSVDCPLRVVAHVDLDAFYAQCEMKRLGVPREEPLAVQQWANLIAVNYPAREKGVTRHITAVEAKKLCPEIRLVHVAVWTPGSTEWRYNDSSLPSMSLSKSSLDPYRAESKKILTVFRSTCPDAILEKAGIDENFLDLSKPIYEQLVAENEELREQIVGGKGSELLPLPGKRRLDWYGSHLVATEGEDAETGVEEVEEVLDWDDVVLAIGAGMVKRLRDAVWEELGYTCSGGIASNKMLAKLGSAFKKPSQQSVVRARAVQPFLNRHKYTKIRNLGGKLGTQIVDHVGSQLLPDLLPLTLPDLTSFLPDDTATWVYNTIRGHDRTPVTPRTATKSMLSAKSFRPPSLPSTPQHAFQWLHVFIADIWARIEDEEAFTQVVRRPRVMTLAFLGRGAQRSRQMPIVGGEGRDALRRTAETLLRAVLEEGGGRMGLWPCMRMTLDVSGFEDRETGSGNIGDFFTRKAASLPPPPLLPASTSASASILPTPSSSEEVETDLHPSKRQRITSPPAADSSTPVIPPSTSTSPSPAQPAPPQSPLTNSNPSTTTPPPSLLLCNLCNLPIPPHELPEHQDWHVAKDLEKAWWEEERRQTPQPAQPGQAAAGKKGKKKVAGGREKREKGQTVLRF
ncbi:DNA/RNA polymerase [Ascodesmis nigricans]|uniref:DNA/RNA polymerase n=1 Tax=Ascodesmis nigricans TaxID=341454 RepID=A0A4S2MR94_9PEZI|nr:DNA/RNA polymerase [Ascodesmis nigricans]